MFRCLALLRHGCSSASTLLALGARLLGADSSVAVRVLIHPPDGSGPERWTSLLAHLDEAERWAREIAGPDADVDAVLELPSEFAADLVLIDPSLPRAVTEAALQAGVAVLWPGPDPQDRLEVIALPYTGSPRSLLPPLAWFEHHPAGRSLLAIALDPDARAIPADVPASLLNLSIPVTHEILPQTSSRLAALRARLTADPCDLVAMAAPTGPELWPAVLLLQEVHLPCPVLLVPSRHGVLDLRPQMHATDLLELGGAWLGGVVRVDAIGRVRRVRGEKLSVFADGALVGEVQVERGALLLAAAEHDHVGIAHVPELAAIETAAGVLRLPGDPIVLLLPGTGPLTRAPDTRIWAVHFAGGPNPSQLRDLDVDGVLDGDALLGEGWDDDLPEAGRPARFDRVMRRLVLHGAPILNAPPPPADQSRAELLRVLAGARPARADVIGLLLDNASARTSLLEHFASAERSIWMQTFMFEDDRVGRMVAEALLAAAERGVQVLLLVDSVFAGHGLLGRLNPALAGLDAHPRCEVRSSHPVRELLDFRRREHRKLLVVDGAVARISGRNVGTPYYTGYDEVPLEPDTPIRDVPWLDCGVDLTGGVVGELARAFKDGWEQAGGSLTLEALPPTDEGSLACQVVLHETLADAFTLEAYRTLLESAQRSVMLVNTFPIQFELQRVLLKLLARGVAVRFLVGNVRPMWGAEVPFPGEPYRELATAVVHGRLDPLARAGADVRELVLRWREPWDPAIERILPHVHSKLLTVDGEVASVGSANLDIAASYWDSEALLIIEDEEFCARLDGKLNTLFEGSRPFDPEDATWKERAARRKDVSRWWPSWAT